jgi:thymidine phosphorylase
LREAGCVVWGGAVRLSPAEDVLLRVERALDLDAEGQPVASVLSKKAAVGASHLVLDLPVGPTAKVRSPADAERLADHLVAVSRSLGITARALLTDGTQPVGRGIGPALGGARRARSVAECAERAVIAENTTLVLSTGSDLFKFLKSMATDGAVVPAQRAGGTR